MDLVISFFSVPAYNKTLDNFDKYNFYIFKWELENSKFNLEAILKSQFLWIWNELKIEDSEEEYINIKRIWRILSVWKFTAIYEDNYPIDISVTNTLYNEVVIEKEKLFKAFQRQHEEFHLNKEDKIKACIPWSFYYIFCWKKYDNKDSNSLNGILKYNEKILQPAKEICNVRILLDSNFEYIKISNYIDTVKISPNTFFSYKNNYVIINWEKQDLDDKLIHREILKIWFINTYNFDFKMFNILDYNDTFLELEKNILNYDSIKSKLKNLREKLKDSGINIKHSSHSSKINIYKEEN